MKKTLAALAVAMAAMGSVRASSDEQAASSDEQAETFAVRGRFLQNGNVCVLGYDGNWREVVMLTTSEYSDLTNAVAYLNDQKDFRRRIHGNVVKSEIDADLKVIRHIYADGYVYTERMKSFSGSPAKPVEKASVAPTKPSWMTDAQWEARRRRETPQKPREVSAIFTPGREVGEVGE